MSVLAQVGAWGGAIGSPVAIAISVGSFVLGWRHRRKDDNRWEDAERRRLTPQWSVDLDEHSAHAVVMTIVLTGPAELEQLDRLRLTVLDDRPDHDQHLAAGQTAEEVRRVIFGPYRVTQGITGRDEIGRSVELNPALVGDPVLVRLERSLPPPWYSQGTPAWRESWDGKPLRVALTAWRGEMTWPRKVFDLPRQSTPVIA